MTARLTDEELAEAFDIARGLLSLKLTAAVAELQARRAADLSAEDVEALRYMKCFAEEVHGSAREHGLEREHIDIAERALDVIDRIIASGGGK